LRPPTTAYEATIHADFLPSPALWAAAEPLLPDALSGPGKRGRPRTCNRQMFFAIYSILVTGRQWKALPRCLGAASTVNANDGKGHPIQHGSLPVGVALVETDAVDGREHIDAKRLNA